MFCAVIIVCFVGCCCRVGFCRFVSVLCKTVPCSFVLCFLCCVSCSALVDFVCLSIACLCPTKPAFVPIVLSLVLFVCVWRCSYCRFRSPSLRFGFCCLCRLVQKGSLVFFVLCRALASVVTSVCVVSPVAAICMCLFVCLLGVCCRTLLVLVQLLLLRYIVWQYVVSPHLSLRALSCVFLLSLIVFSTSPRHSLSVGVSLSSLNLCVCAVGSIEYGTKRRRMSENRCASFIVSCNLVAFCCSASVGFLVLCLMVKRPASLCSSLMCSCCAGSQGRGAAADVAARGRAAPHPQIAP